MEQIPRIDGTTPRLTKARANALIRVRDFEGSITPPELAERGGYSVQRAHTLLGDLEQRGYVEIDRDPNGNLAKLTVSGWRAAYLITGGRKGVEAVDGDVGEMYLKGLHGVVIRLNVKNDEFLPEDWRAQIRKRSDVVWGHLEHEGDEMWSAVIAGWTVHLRRRSVACYLRERVEGWTGQGCIRELTTRIQRVADRVREMTGAHLEIGSVEIGRMEVGVEKHHLALLLDAVPELSLDDVKIYDREEPDRVELEYDKSPGFPELELKGAERAMEIQETVEAESRHLAHHGDARQWGHGWERRMRDMGIGPETAAEVIAREADGAMPQKEEDTMAQSKSEGGEEEREGGENTRRDESGWVHMDGGTWRTW